MLYFAVSEASQWQGTLGKRALKLRVAAHSAGGRLSFRRTLLRAALKFAPWELAHTVLWRVEGWPLESPQPTTVHWLGFAVSLLWAGWYLLSLFVGSQRTLYDRAAASVVVRPSVGAWLQGARHRKEAAGTRIPPSSICGPVMPTGHDGSHRSTPFASERGPMIPKECA